MAVTMLIVLPFYEQLLQLYLYYTYVITGMANTITCYPYHYTAYSPTPTYNYAFVSVRPDYRMQ